MSGSQRLIEAAFPLRQASLDSAHEKNVRHGHISTLHVWPARRPLAACRAAILATLLPDPGNPEAREKLCREIGGKIIESKDSEKRLVARTENGILRWPGSEPKGPASKKREYRQAMALRAQKLAHFRAKIRAANNGKAPRVYDPFSGGGAIPLEAMRLGCEAFANDLNPVAVFLLAATLKYPQAIGISELPLPAFAKADAAFMREYRKARPANAKSGQAELLEKEADPCLANLAWHVRAWGKWVLNEARKELAGYYPAWASWRPLDPQAQYTPIEDVIAPLDANGEPDLAKLNAIFDAAYLADEANPRWLASPVVAYLWARTAVCQNPACRKTIPLLKTKWLAKTASGKRVLLACEPDETCDHGLRFGVTQAPKKAAKKADPGQGYMSRAGATCPHCGSITGMEELRRQGKAGLLGQIPTAVVYEGENGKEYRPWRAEEIAVASAIGEEDLQSLFANIPFGLPEENLVEDTKRNTWCVQYGVKRFRDLFSRRQLFSLGTLLLAIRKAMAELAQAGYDEKWREAIGAYLAVAFDRLADRQSMICRWDGTRSNHQSTFSRFALPMGWDFSEAHPFSESTGNFYSGVEWIAEYIETILNDMRDAPTPQITRQSAAIADNRKYDAIITDPPYYDAIGYCVLMDFFYVWLRRVLCGTPLDSGMFASELGPKWDSASQDGELIDDASRHGGDRLASKKAYEDGMARVFQNCNASLEDDGRFVVVFAHKNADAWETLVSAIIRAGFTVTASWPIQTEMGNRMRGLDSAALSSSVWLVCKKRPADAKPGWDNAVLAEMETNITEKLREFWDAGLRGPDFVWAATGPALAAYSAYPRVIKADSNGAMSASEFLAQARRMVVNFVVGRMIGPDAGGEPLDKITTYYLLHRNDFGLNDAPAGACILYAAACGANIGDLENVSRILKRGGTDSDGDSGGRLRLARWDERGSAGREGQAPLIDCAHRVAWLWSEGDRQKVDAYIDSMGLRASELFQRVLQALIELASGEERNHWEAISKHLGSKGALQKRRESGNLEGSDGRGMDTLA